MPQPRRYRDQPVETFNLTPRSKAYACFTDQGYTIARDAFLSKFLSLASEVGPWAGDTLTCLYNYLIASIKLCNYDEAEEQCKYISGLIYSLRMGEEQCFMCLQCILATSCFLSGKLAEAEHLYTNIYLRRTRSQAHVREHFDVLSLVRYTSRDCLVLWESPLELSVLMPVTNYVDQLDERRPQKNAIRSQIGALCRLAPLIRHSPTHSSRDGTDVRRLRTLQIQRALRQQAMAVVDSGRAERYIRFKLPSPGFFAATSPLISAANGERIVFPKIRSDRGELGEVKKAEKVVDLGFHARNHTVIEPVQHRVAKWLNDQKQRPPMPDEPLDVVFDGLGLTHRSSETTSSSVSLSPASIEYVLTRRC